MTIASLSWRRQGAALAVVLCVIALTSAISATVFSVVSNRYRTLHHSSAWQEALVASEAGIHQGMAQLARSVTDSGYPSGAQSFKLLLSHGGETTNGAEVEYTLRRNDVTQSGMRRPYYAIVSTGTVRLPGSLSLSSDERDVNLRKLHLMNRVARRTLEAWARPVTATDVALKAEKKIVLSSHKIAIDSFNSDDPNRSMPGGLPPKTIGQFNVAPYDIMKAHIATNSKFIGAGDASVYGDALTNGGTVGNSEGIHGNIRDDYYEPSPAVFPPYWVSTTPPGVMTNSGFSTSLTTGATIVGGTIDNPARYVVDSVNLAGSRDTVKFDFSRNSDGTADPAKGHIELYVRGDFNAEGAGNAGSVEIVNGVKVKIWFVGDASVSGNSSTNTSNTPRASSLALYGVNAPTPRPNQKVSLNGNSGFYGTVYAPSADLYLSGGGGKGTFVGSLVGRNAFLKGNADIRYDEALGGLGHITGFKLVSWFEDTKPAGTFTGQL